MLTEGAKAWRDSVALEPILGSSLFVREQAGSGPPVLLLHGFPTCSYDWRGVCALLAGRRVTAFDFLGFGLSDKPSARRYSLMHAAAATEAVAARFGDSPVVLAAHDMGTSVATELLARDLDGSLPFELAGVLLFNGSIVLERALLTISQKLLRSPLGPLMARLSNPVSVRVQMARLFSSAHPLSAAEAADQWSLLAHNGGNRILDRLIFYLGERVEYAERWHGAIRDWPGNLELAWALRDPVATEAVLDAVRALRPSAPVTSLPDLGHYPQLEDPSALAEIIDRMAGETTKAKDSSH